MQYAHLFDDSKPATYSIDLMNSEYYLDIHKLKTLVAKRGYVSMSQFLIAIGLHRNTLLQYQQKKKSVFSSAFEKIVASLQADPLKLMTQDDARSDTLQFAEEDLREIVQKLAVRHPSAVFVLLGSRARGSARQYSDWDLGISGGNAGITSDQYLLVKDELETATDNLPVSVDLVSMDAAPLWFLQQVGKDPKFFAGNRAAYFFLMGVLDGIAKASKDQ